VRNSKQRHGPGASALAAGVLVVAFLVASGCSSSAPEIGSEEGVTSYPTDERPMSSLELIEDAMRAGALEYSTALLYKVYVMFEPESLPQEYQSDVPSKCGTPVISEVQRNWNMLSPDDRAEIAQYIEPIGIPGDDDTQLDDVTPDRLEDEREKLD